MLALHIAVHVAGRWHVAIVTFFSLQVKGCYSRVDMANVAGLGMGTSIGQRFTNRKPHLMLSFTVSPTFGPSDTFHSMYARCYPF
jgi:hypothetical protein